MVDLEAITKVLSPASHTLRRERNSLIPRPHPLAGRRARGGHERKAHSAKGLGCGLRDWN